MPLFVAGADPYRSDALRTDLLLRTLSAERRDAAHHSHAQVASRRHTAWRVRETSLLVGSAGSVGYCGCRMFGGGQVIGNFRCPVDGSMDTDDYGPRADGSFHYGIDMHAPESTPLWAVKSGTVNYTLESAGASRHVRVRSPHYHCRRDSDVMNEHTPDTWPGVPRSRLPRKGAPEATRRERRPAEPRRTRRDSAAVPPAGAVRTAGSAFRSADPGGALPTSSSPAPPPGGASRDDLPLTAIR
jgi:hypothetical protein